VKNSVIKLTPPLLSDDHIDQKISCIRPHRERIFNISREHKDGKTIFHNYGHGGAGWTFLFGCVNESMRQFQAAGIDKNKKICVVGAGCYGLLTAIELARAGYSVRIVAKETQNISSDKAAGFFFPRWRKSSSALEITEFTRLGLESYATYLDIIKGTHPFMKTGAQLLPAYYHPEIDPGFAPYIKHGLMSLPQETTIDFSNGKQYSALQYTTVFIHTNQSMALLKELRHSLGIGLDLQEISSFDDVEESIIFNCAGFGAKTLVPDARMIPVQGHLITLRNQPIESLQYMINTRETGIYTRNNLIYFAPKGQGVLGITFLRNQSDIHANTHEFERLLMRCRDFFGT
jgi:glycine/D-amino acid oxidase-like deaminating enzyme